MAFDKEESITTEVLDDSFLEEVQKHTSESISKEELKAKLKRSDYSDISDSDADTIERVD